VKYTVLKQEVFKQKQGKHYETHSSSNTAVCRTYTDWKDRSFHRAAVTCELSALSQVAAVLCTPPCSFYVWQILMHFN